MGRTRTASWGISVAFLFLASLPTWAAAVTDVWSDAAGDVLLDLNNSGQAIPGVRAFYGYQHDITDDGFAIGDAITSATLFVSLGDVGGSETYEYEIGLGPLQTTNLSNVPNHRIDEMFLTTPSLDDLEIDGVIDVLIRITGDSNNQQGFYFVSSSLVAQVDSITVQPAQVPEPAILALIAVALMISWMFSLASTGARET